MPSEGLQFLGDVDAASAARLIEAASDITLVLSDDGTIRHAAFQDPELAGRMAQAWQGRLWSDTVADDSRDKVASLLHDAFEGEGPHWRQLNHPLAGEDGVPVLYSALSLPDARGGRRIVAFGRDLRSTVLLQRRLIEAQQAMERDYWRFREAETRYRNLFQTSPEAVLVVDGQSQKVLEANPAALALTGLGLRLVGAFLSSLFDVSIGDPLSSLMTAARSTGRREAVRLTLAQGRGEVDVVASLFRQDQSPFLLLRMVPFRPLPAESAQAARSGDDPEPDTRLLDAYARHCPDGLVFTDTQGRILSVNRAFAQLAQIGAEEQAQGQLLDRWLGRTGVEVGVLINNLRQRGAIGLFSSTLRGESGAVVDVEISASLVGGPQASTLAFAVRDVGRRLQAATDERQQPKLARSASELSELVGRVPMKDIVSETTDLIEHLCIETALEMTQNNRALAAQLLGLSRQSLYVKLRQFGVGESRNDNPG